ncbi:hypothetical protein NHX12_029051 [Muraenolepis orangiensis]|uniref:ZAD domain-containing protein n=1 Tax=Muraenolepis orangiensis TaxID=630683 RepID=A0A9Q0EFA6_9TELE|nr:hypothetical protein NHX12_029051 [Muraenolepis orangiensis]
MEPKSIKPSRTKSVRGVCRLCGDEFSSLKDRCDLLPNTGAGGKPSFTLVLEDITGPVSAGDDLTAVCVRCKQHLTRYHRHKTDVERRGTAIRDLAAKSVFARKKTKKRCAATAMDGAPTQTQRKRPKCAGTPPPRRRRRAGSAEHPQVGSPAAAAGRPDAPASHTHTSLTVAAVESQEDADAVSMATSSAAPPTTVCPLTAPSETSISSPSTQSVQAAVGKVSQKDADAVSTATSSAAPSALTAPPGGSICSPSTQSVQEDVVGTTARELSVRPPPKTYDIGPGQRSTARVIVTTPKWKHSRIVTGPLERIVDALVRGEHYRLPRCLMKVPGMDHIMIEEVLKRVREEAIKLTSVRFGSVLRQTTQDALDKFEWTDVVSEWRTHAPTFLKFLECVSSASFDGLQASESSYTKTKKGATVMAGATLLRARVHQMNAMQHRNSLLLRQGGTNKRCLARLSRLGCCVSSKRKMATKKAKVIRTVDPVGEGQEAEGALHEQSLAEEQSGVQELPPSGATSLEALLGLDGQGGEDQTGVQELSASEVTSLEALLGLEDGGGDQSGVQELPPSGATSLEALLGLDGQGGEDQTPAPDAGDEQEHKKTGTDQEDVQCQPFIPSSHP